MQKTQDTSAKRKPGRPAIMDGDVVNVNLRMSTQDRDTLRMLGGAAWLRSQLAAVRSSGNAAAPVAVQAKAHK